MHLCIGIYTDFDGLETARDSIRPSTGSLNTAQGWASVPSLPSCPHQESRKARKTKYSHSSVPLLFLLDVGLIAIIGRDSKPLKQTPDLVNPDYQPGSQGDPRCETQKPDSSCLK